MTTLPFYLDKGIWLEDMNQVLNWATDIDVLCKILEPEIIRRNESTRLVWRNHRCFGGLLCDVSAVRLHDTMAKRAYHVYLPEFRFASLQVRQAIISSDKELDEEYRRVYVHLCSGLGKPSYFYANYYKQLPSVFWEFPKVKVSYATIGIEKISISVTHEGAERESEQVELKAIRQVEGVGDKVSDLCW